jgi:HK97 family phage major capsid protein
MATLKEILAEQRRIKDELQRMENDGETTEDEGGSLRDTLIERWKELDDQAKPIIERMARIREITRTAEDEANLERPGGKDGTSASRYGSPAGPEVMVRHDPFENLDQVRRGMITREDAISRSLNAIETHAKRGLLPDDRAEAATQKAQWQPLVARHMLLTGADEYMEAFRAYLEDPLGSGKQQAERAMTLATGQGGFLLPYVLDPTIILTSAGSTNPYRQLASVKQTTSNAWQGVNSAGITAQLLAEAVTATDATPTMGQIQIWPQKFAAWVFGSFEVEQDTNFAEQLPGLLADAKDIVEETQFVVGTGGTGNSTAPQGVLHALGASQKVAAAEGTGGVLSGGTGASVSIASSNVYNLQAALGPRFRKSKSVGWVANITSINRLRGLDQAGGSSFWANFGDDTPEQLLGKQIHESPSLTTTTATGTGTGSAVMVYGDWSKFYVVDRIGTSMIYEPMITGTGAAANLPTGQAGWFYFWRAGSDVATANAFRWLANGS